MPAEDRDKAESNDQSNDQSSDESAGQDAQLVAAVLDGDGSAFDPLVRRHQRKAVAVAYRVLGDVHEAADIAQDAFLRAYRRLDTLQDPQRFGSWLMRIVSNLALNRRRVAKPWRMGDQNGEDDLITATAVRRGLSGQLPSDSLAPDQHSQQRELQQAIERAIAELPEKQRLALVLFSIEGRPQKEVAQELDCSLELVKWNVFQARKKLRAALAEYFQE